MAENILAVVPTEKAKDESLETYFNDGRTIKYAKGETIIDGLDEPDGVYIIKQGFVKAYTLTKSGQENLLLVHDTGEFIPLLWALDGTHTEGLYYVAMSDVTVLKTTKEKLRSAMSDDKWLSQEILKQSVHIITIYSQRITALQYRTARERIIAELLNLAEMFGKTSGKKVLIDVPITHQDIANSINMTRETASRAFGLLFEEELLSQDEHFFTIVDISKLEKELG
ncbi:Crp/Fnr family transcriptional regulator [Candidatus Saccharibacteria bacterium]|nr:Crp/Fnr family transcriptional regulator [Candidatus Saccharibacteria bacterium]